LAGSVVFVDMPFPRSPHSAALRHTLGLGKTGAGALTAAYPLGVLIGAIPSGAVAARLGVKPTVVVGLSTVAVCVVVFGLADHAWQLFVARFVQGIASAFSWTGALAWLIAAAPEGRRGMLIGSAFAAAVGGTLFGPVLGGVASLAGTGWTFGVVGVASLGMVAFAATTTAAPPEEPQPLSALFAAFRDRQLLACFWLVLLPGLLFGNLSVLVPLRLSHLGYSGAAIGAVFLCTAALESGNNILVGRLRPARHNAPDPAGPPARRCSPLSCPGRTRRSSSPSWSCSRARVRRVLHSRAHAPDPRVGGARARLRLRVRAREPRVGARRDARQRAARALAHATADAVPTSLSRSVASFVLFRRLTSRA
jgi:hypothetical protein